MKPLDLRTLRQDALSLLTCAPTMPCAKEEACFRVVQAFLRSLPDPVHDEPEDPDVIADYAPDWSAS